MLTFPHGIHPIGKKELSAGMRIVDLPASETVYIPLLQHVGKEALPIVVKGDKIKVGQKIGEADGVISASVFSSVSGEVLGIEKKATATGHCNHVVIKNDGEYNEAKLSAADISKPDAIIRRIADSGIVGQGGAGFPTAVKLSPKEKVDTFIINGAECEPYLTCDYRIMLEQTVGFLKGAECMARALGLSEFYIGLEDNKADVVEIIEKAAEEHKISVKCVLCHTKYPQGAEKQLIYAVTGRKVRVGKLPSSVGVIVSNVHTALSVYNAVCEGITSYSRILTVSGEGVKNPGNFRVRTGTSVNDVLAHCGGVGENVEKMLIGGPMMGVSVANGDIAVTKTTGGILLLGSEEVCEYETEPCINCGACARACPMRLMPMYIDSYILSGDVAGAVKYGAPNCIECGSCAYVCPAHRPLVQSIRLAKKKLRERGRK